MWGTPSGMVYLATGHPGADASAVIYSLMLTCRACNIEPYSYLRHVLTELPQRPTGSDITDLLPFNFIAR